MDIFRWANTSNFDRKTYKCGYCGVTVGPDCGYYCDVIGHNQRRVNILLCPACKLPTYLDKEKQVPAPRLGENVNGITDVGVQALYNEARDCTSVGSYTAAALLCRKILMNIAVQHGADPGKSFFFYVEFLVTEGYVPPNGKPWVDIIRKKGNEATHEIALMTKIDAEQILHFVVILLRFIYEFPSMLKE